MWYRYWQGTAIESAILGTNAGYVTTGEALGSEIEETVVAFVICD